jgi:hypothetical protein
MVTEFNERFLHRLFIKSNCCDWQIHLHGNDIYDDRIQNTPMKIIRNSEYYVSEDLPYIDSGLDLGNLLLRHTHAAGTMEKTTTNISVAASTNNCCSESKCVRNQRQRAMQELTTLNTQ